MESIRFGVIPDTLLVGPPSRRSAKAHTQSNLFSERTTVAPLSLAGLFDAEEFNVQDSKTQFNLPTEF